MSEAGGPLAFDHLLSEMRTTVIPNLARYPRSGRRYLENPPQSVEALHHLAKLSFRDAGSLYEYAHRELLLLYAALDAYSTICLLSIRHQRQLSLDCGRVPDTQNN